jgi:acetyl esterase
MVNSTGGSAVSHEGEGIDPDIRRFVREMSAAWAKHPGFAAASPVEQRRIADVVRAPWTRGGPTMAAVTESHVPCRAGSVRVRRYDPGPAGKKPALIYLHGGGWTIFSLETHDRLMREYAGRTGAVVIGVDYALSPEAKYPVALEQVYTVVRHVSSLEDSHDIDTGRIAIGGDSAGGNLAMATCLRLRDEGLGSVIKGLLLNYPVLERWSSAAARERCGGPGNMLTSDEMETFWHNYLRSDEDAEDPLVCFGKANLRGLPPVFLVAGDQDVLAEQSVAMASRLRASNVPATLNVYRGATHSFLEAVSIAPLADRALAETASWLTSTLTKEAP